MWPREGLIRLNDGRVLGFTECGDPDGRPCFYFHGNPSSRLQGLALHRCASHQGIRVIAPERPGCGVSTFLAGRTFSSWADDVAALADEMAIERFAVMGVSGGCAYVWACAARLPDRVAIAVPVSGHTPPHIPGAFEGVNSGEMLGLRLSGRAPWLTRIEFWRKARQARRRYAAQADPAGGDGCYDRSRSRLDSLESRRQGGAAQWWESVLYGRTWGFDVEAVRPPVHLWHGSADTAASPAGARSLASRVPACTLHFVEGVGHELIATATHEIIGVVAAGLQGET